MKVLFLETIEGSASMGEVKDVTNGYARNYLLPKGYAVPATVNNLKDVEVLQAKELVMQKDKDEWANAIFDKLEDAVIFEVPVGQQGKLYGSVNQADIASKISVIVGKDVDRRSILLPEIIRQVGVHEVSIRLSKNITALVKVVVVDQESEQIEDLVKSMLADFDKDPVVNSMNDTDAILNDDVLVNDELIQNNELIQNENVSVKNNEELESIDS
ncbi:MAG: Ribosomal protein L9 [Chloroflexi bacterium]|nr:MAG: Ribosomal protein L9 [Chloroflexota bacterium]